MAAAMNMMAEPSMHAAARVVGYPKVNLCAYCREDRVAIEMETMPQHDGWTAISSGGIIRHA